MNCRLPCTLALLLTAALCATAPASALANAPAITRFAASPTTLSAAGGRVRLQARVSAASVCRFSAANPQPGLPARRPCSYGHASVTVTIAPNHRATARYYRFLLTVGRRQRSVTVSEAGAVPPAPPTPTPVAPTVTTNPASQSVTTPASASFTVAASGTPTPTVQWLVSDDGGGSWSVIGGATSDTYTFTTTLSESGWLYRAELTNSAGSTLSNVATLTVSSLPAVTVAPQSLALTSGSGFTLTAAASGTPTPTVQWQISADNGVSWNAIAGATSDSYSTTAADLGTFAYRAVFTNSAGMVASASATLTTTPAASPNWSGYVATNAAFTAVSGSWSVPAVSCAANANSAGAQWVGIDGYGGVSVEQDGVEFDCRAGVPTYYAWYETYGYSTVGGGAEIPVAHPVAPGDAMSASVVLSAGTWTFTLNDTTEGWSDVIPVGTLVPPPAQASAEWVVEEPTTGVPAGQLLSAFTSAAFTNAQASAGTLTGPISAFSYVALQMTDSGHALATPSPLSDGSAFTDRWQAAS